MKAQILMLTSSHICGIDEAIQFLGSLVTNVKHTSGIVESGAIVVKVIQLDKGQPMQTLRKLQGSRYDMVIVAPSLDASLRKGCYKLADLIQEIYLIRQHVLRPPVVIDG